MSDLTPHDPALAPLPAKKSFHMGLVVIPLVLVGLLAAGWSAFWYQQVGKFETRLDELIEREASLGKQWTCAQRKIGGFPFRLEATCGKTSLVLKDAGLSLGIGTVRAVAQAYDPSLMIIEADGPMQITNQASETWTTKWELARSSVRFDLKNLKDLPERSSLEIKSISVFAPNNPKVSTTIESIDVQARRNPEKFATERAFDLAFTVTNLVDFMLAEITKTNDPLTLSYDLTITRNPEPSKKPLPEQLELWRIQGGLVTLRQMMVNRGPFNLVMSGEMGLDAQHRPDFRLDTKVKGLDELLKASGQKADILNLLGGKRAASGEMTFNLRTQSGQAFLGPLPLGKMPPLY
jgi:hypothetical protein